MQTGTKALIIAGSDPSCGAGLQADLKTMEAHRVYACTVATAITWQHESEFAGLEWVKEQVVLDQLRTLLKKYRFSVAKIGIIESPALLQLVCDEVRIHNADIKIVWDPVLKASAGFQFHSDNIMASADFLSHMELITPNWNELRGETEEEKFKYAFLFSAFTNVLIKGGHRESEHAVDCLFQKRNQEIVKFQPDTIAPVGKHGSGCVLASSIAANLYHGKSLHDAITNAKKYVTKFLLSSDTLLGVHFSDNK